MKIFVRANPSSKKEKVEKINDVNFKVSVKEPPIAGRANAAILRLLAEYFGVNASGLTIVSGQTGRQKVIKISNENQQVF